MKIGIFEIDLSSQGGRQRTMISFADFLKESGHEVFVFAGFSRDFLTPGITASTFLSWHNTAALDYSDIFLGKTQADVLCGEDVIRRIKSLDAALVPGFLTYDIIRGIKEKIRGVCWMIRPRKAAFRTGATIWTNSHTTRSHICAGKNMAAHESRIHVVRPPHDYSLFRKSSRNWEDRSNDVVCVGSLVASKMLVESAVMAKRRGCSVTVVAGNYVKNQEEADSILNCLSAEGIHVVQSAKPKDVARIMGNSKVFLSATSTESCPLVIYEALNAGCSISTRLVGAIAEQLGVHGHTFSCDIQDGLTRALASKPDKRMADTAIQYDRTRVGKTVLDRISELV